jgi:hypothetical protein
MGFIDGFSVGIGGGEGSRKSGIMKLPIPVKRDYAKLRNALGIQYSIENLSIESFQKNGETSYLSMKSKDKYGQIVWTGLLFVQSKSPHNIA